jgi:hypothetical protein
MKQHPGQAQLALFAGGDPGFLDRWRIGLHLKRCLSCQKDVEVFRSSMKALSAETSELPAGVNWDRLAAEMTANIHVGLEAGECVGPVRPQSSAAVSGLGWRAAAVMAAMSVILLVAWALNPPQHRAPHGLRAPKIEIRNTATGLELNENGNALVLLHGRGMRIQRPIIVSAPGTLKARFVDEDTDQITINHAYVE